MEHPRFDSTTRFLSECEDFSSFLDTASPAALEAYADKAEFPFLLATQKAKESEDLGERLAREAWEAERALEEEEDKHIHRLIDTVIDETRRRELQLETIRIASSTTVPDLMID
jgi:hypothetical protein